MLQMPDFMKSPYVVSNGTGEGWHVSDDAPQDVKRELQRQLDEWMRQGREAEAEGICV